ncbi:MAG: hypothetical protein HRT45_17360 [Bdellovibrionales bacterium]|nr:hypothetical protein [Bdellovibrionales bacterium]
MRRFSILLILVMAFSSAFAAKKSQNAEPYSFQRWKDHQVVEARNQVVRLTNRMHLLKTGRYKLDTEQMPLLEAEDEKLYKELKALGDDKKTEKAETEQLLLKSVESRMQMAIENLQIAKDLSIDDYLAVYLSRYSEDTSALKRLVDRLSKEEVLELLQARLKPSESADELSIAPPTAAGIIQLQSESSKN